MKYVINSITRQNDSDDLEVSVDIEGEHIVFNMTPHSQPIGDETLWIVSHDAAWPRFALRKGGSPDERALDRLVVRVHEGEEVEFPLEIPSLDSSSS